MHLPVFHVWVTTCILLSTCIVENDSGILCKSNHLIGLFAFFNDWSDSIVFHNLFEGRSIGSAIRRPKGLVGNNWWKRRGDVVAATNLPTCQSTWQREQLGTKTWGATCSCFHRYQMEPVRLSKPIYIKDYIGVLFGIWLGLINNSCSNLLSYPERNIHHWICCFPPLGHHAGASSSNARRYVPPPRDTLTWIWKQLANL